MKSKKFAPKNLPDIEKTLDAFKEFCQTIACLRDPKKGCPWDLEQSHKSLRQFMIEEAYEASEAMDNNNDAELCDELGDVLLQVVLNAQLAFDRKSFSIADVIQSIENKMLRRHPHVFSNAKGNNIKEVLANWQVLKDKEKKPTQNTWFEQQDINKVHPATRQALKIGKRAKQVHFDWHHPDEVLKKLLSEINELKKVWIAKKFVKRTKAIKEELGDIYFTLAQVCRHLDMDPEVIASDGNKKFLRRMSKLEKIAKSKKLDLKKASHEALEKLWTAVKATEKK